MLLLVLPIKWNFFCLSFPPFTYKNLYIYSPTKYSQPSSFLSIPSRKFNFVMSGRKKWRKMWKVLHALFLLPPPPSATFQTINFSSFCKFSSSLFLFVTILLIAKKVFFLLLLRLWHCCAEWNTLFTSWYDWYMFHVVKG